jgi:TetR/AcrR family transcriptional repressor of mexJK operon
MSEHALPNQGPGRPKDPAKRQAILEAAKTLFLRHGYEGSSMDAIAREAGVSKLTVYSHFTDKDTLFCAAVEAKCEEQLPQLFTELSSAAPIEAHLQAIGRAFNALINSEESLAMHRLMFTLAKSNPQLVQLFYAAGPQRILNKMEQVMRQADRHGIDLPISSAVRAVLHGDLTPAAGLQQLLAREQKPEYPETLFKE